jgi:cytochrome c oxidase subunit 2
MMTQGMNVGRDATFWLPDQVSTVAPVVDNVFYVVYWISVFFFVGIVAVMLFFMIRYRRRQEGEAVERSPSHHTPIEVIWTVIPLGLVVWIFWIGFKGYMDLRTPPANSYQVAIEGQQWNWTFAYPNGYVDGVLHVPIGTPVELTMTSQDVLHSFFVPEFRIKMDVLPGKYTKAWFQATKAGEYDVFCTEYCGTNHSAMRTKVIVQDPEAFQAWLTDAADFIKKLPPVEAGQKVFQVRGCPQCHSVDGTAGIGPTFKGVFGRTEALKDGSQVKVDENYIRESVLEPQAKVVAGFEPVMPTYQGRLKDAEITVLIEYLKSLSGSSN